MKLENIIERIHTSPKDDKVVFEELKNDNKPVLIYGCSDYSKVIFEYLKKQGIKIDAFVVDKPYWEENFYIEDKKVLCMNDVALEKYNVVIGFGDVEKSRFLINNEGLLKTKFYFLWEPITCYVWNLDYVKNNWDIINVVFDGLADKRSKRTLFELIVAKLNGCCSKQLLEAADGGKHFNELTFCPDSKDEILIDCGAYNGDTIEQYLDFTDSNYKKIYAFEPGKEIIEVLKKNVSSYKNIEIVNKGVWNENTFLIFEDSGETSHIDNKEGENTVEVTTIDTVVQSDERITFIKMDIEGSELEALQGAVETIKRDMPKLAICCYHKKDDIIELFTFVKNCENSEYRYNIYLRQHSNSAYETVLYAIPVKRN